MWLLYWWIFWAVVQLSISVAVLIAASRNQAARPKAARWTKVVVILQFLSFGVTLLMTAFSSFWNVHVPWDQSLGDMLADPATWAFLVERWILSILPTAMTLITTYVILEQPDRPRTARPEPSAT